MTLQDHRSTGADGVDELLPTVCRRSEGQRIASGGIVYRFLATGDETNGRYALFEATLAPGEGAPFHVHSREEESFTLLEGEVVFYTRTQRIPATPGTFLNASTGVIRGFRNETDQEARMLILVAPAGLENMFREDGIVLTDADEKAPSGTGAKECPTIAARYGIEVMPYPLPSA